MLISKKKTDIFVQTIFFFLYSKVFYLHVAHTSLILLSVMNTTNFCCTDLFQPQNVDKLPHKLSLGGFMSPGGDTEHLFFSTE